MRRERGRAICVLASGGLDSAVLIGDLRRRGFAVQPLYLRAGLRWEKQEIAALRKFLRALPAARLRPLVVLDVPMRDLYGEHWSTTGRGVPGYRASNESVYLPGRNLALLSKGAIFCALQRIPVLAVGVLEANPFADARRPFLAALERACRLGLGTSIRIAAPYRGLSKEEVIRRGRGLPLELTLSCARPRSGRHCGRCTKCAERIGAFDRSGRPDPARYAPGPGRGAPASGAASRKGAVSTMRDAAKKTASVR